MPRVHSEENRKVKKALSAALLFVAFVFPQVQESESEQYDPATREDVRALQERISILQQQAEAAERAAAERSADERRKIISEYERNISALKSELSQKLESIEREARERAKNDQMRERRTFWFVLGIAGLIAAGIGVLIYLRIHAKKVPFVVLREARAGKATDTLMDASADEVVSHARTHNLRRVQIGIRLSEGAVVYAEAEVRENKPPLVWFSDRAKPAVWKNRKSAAAEYYLKEGRSAAS